MKKRLRLLNDDKQTDDDDNHGDDDDDDDGDAETASISKLSTETKWYTHESTWHHGFSWLFTLVLVGHCATKTQIVMQNHVARVPGKGSHQSVAVPLVWTQKYYPLVMTNSSPWYRWPIEIDGLPGFTY